MQLDCQYSKWEPVHVGVWEQANKLPSEMQLDCQYSTWEPVRIYDQLNCQYSKWEPVHHCEHLCKFKSGQ